MQTNARVVIVGGGIMGVSLLHGLAEEGWTDTLLLEKGEITSGSTWHAAGLCANFIGGSYSMAKIHGYAIDLYSTMNKTSGEYVSWHGCGGLRLALTQNELDWFHLVCSFGASLDCHMEVIGPEEIAKIHPFLNLEGVLGAAYTKNDGHVDPAGCCNALAERAVASGARIERRSQVMDIKQRPNGEWEVSTDKGVVIAEHVVNAAGCYARKLQQGLGGDLPIVNMLHHYIVTDTVPELQEIESELPVVRDPYSSCYLRQEQKSGLIGPYQTSGANEAWPGAAPDWQSENELFEPDYERIGPWLEKAMQRLPIFGADGIGIRTAVHGAIPHTPDGNPLLGPVAGLKNFWLCCGTAIGIVQGPGCGKYLAQWMVHGDAEIAMNMFDPRRFGPYATMEYARAKCHQEYENMYAVPLPGEQYPLGRPVRTSPLYETLKGKGARYTEAGGWERPNWFSTDGREEKCSYRRSNVHEVVAEECRAVRERVGVMDMSSFAKYDIGGGDAENFLNRVTANRVASNPGGITLNHMLSENGYIMNEFTVTRLNNDLFYILTAAPAEQRDFDILEKARSGENIKIKNVTEETGVLVLAGPRARDLLAKLTDADLSNAAFRWLSGREIDIAGVPTRALRVNYVGELGWELHMPINKLAHIYSALWDAGDAFGIADFGAYAMNSLRMEKAYRGWGSELTNEITPIEADLARFVKLDKSDFIGRRALLNRNPENMNTTIVYLQVEATDSDVHGGEPLFTDGRCVGLTTSGAYGHTTGKSLAFAYVDSQFKKPGTEFEIPLLGEARKAHVLAEPAYDPSNVRLRA